MECSAGYISLEEPQTLSKYVSIGDAYSSGRQTFLVFIMSGIYEMVGECPSFNNNTFASIVEHGARSLIQRN